MLGSPGDLPGGSARARSHPGGSGRGRLVALPGGGRGRSGGWTGGACSLAGSSSSGVNAPGSVSRARSSATTLTSRPTRNERSWPDAISRRTLSFDSPVSLAVSATVNPRWTGTELDSAALNSSMPGSVRPVGSVNSRGCGAPALQHPHAYGRQALYVSTTAPYFAPRVPPNEGHTSV